VAYEREYWRWSLRPARDGTFQIEGVRPGTYRLAARYFDGGSGLKAPFADWVWAVEVPESVDAAGDEPLDIGAMDLQSLTAQTWIGDPAAPFSFRTVDGETVRLDDYLGMHVLLDFGTGYDDKSRTRLAYLDEAYESHGKNGHVQFLSVIFALDNAESRAFVAAKKQPWPQVLVGTLANNLSLAYRLTGPHRESAQVLIGPDGRVAHVFYGMTRDDLARALSVNAGRAAPKRTNQP
jgi:hypothetical protein